MKHFLPTALLILTCLPTLPAEPPTSDALASLTTITLPVATVQVPGHPQELAASVIIDKGVLYYTISHAGKPVMERSRLGFQQEDGSEFLTGVTLVEERSKMWSKTWKPVCGERETVPDICAETLIKLRGAGDRRMNLIVRAYPEGIAFCYEFESPQTFAAELTEFAFAADYQAWPVYTAQGVYERQPISAIKPKCQRPLLVEAGENLRLAVGEARLVDFARMLLTPVPGKPMTLRAELGSKVTFAASPEKPYRTPWRYIAVASSVGRLLEQNYFPLNLNEPCAIADTSWIKPGKVIRETTLTTDGGKACVDFAAQRGLQYIEFDAGWYGPEHDDASDATTVTVDPKRSKGPLDLQEVIRHADAKGIGVIVYVNRRALEKQLDALLPLYQKWGIKGIKFGFVNVGSQQWTTWLHESIKKCADHQIMVDVHDEHRDTGWTRTFPNLMTVEGIRGNEEMPPPEHNVISALTRMLAGTGDYTPCWYTDRVKTSRAHQLALPIVFYSPWTFLYWYDRPAMYRGEPELDLWKELPTTWDDTQVLIDDLPNAVAIARRSGNVWYVGVLNALEERTLRLPVSELPGWEKAASKTITRYADGEGKAVKIDAVKTVDTVDLLLRANGGAVLKIVVGK